MAEGYIHDKYLDGYGPGFLTGGQSKNHEIRNTIDQTGKIDLTWQVNHTHSLKTGFHFFQHEIDNQWRSIRNKYHNTANDSIYVPEVYIVHPETGDEMTIVFNSNSSQIPSSFS